MIAYSNVASKDYASHDDLVTSHISLVKRIAHHLAARLPSTVDIDDLQQSGMIGLLEAASNFDPTRGASFDTYAGIRIRGAMLDDIRKQDWTPRSVHQKYRQVSEAVRAIEGETGRPAEAKEIAKRLGISLDDYHNILSDSAGCRLFSLEETLDEPTFGRDLPASNTATPDQALRQSQFRQELADSIQQLPERERLVLSLYYERELNLKEIGEVLGVSESRVCQIHGQAMIRLRASMKE
jgi:RNA polymerase sigma factor for flagellar operon FliA